MHSVQSSLLQTIPGELVERFRCEIPAQITLRTRNCNCSIVEAAKYPDKIVISAGWATFVDTYDLHMDGSVLFRYDGNSQFNVIIFDQFGCEEALSILQDYADLPRHDPERCINATEAMKCCERCKDLDDYKYYHLDNEEKYFVVFMKSDFQNEMVRHGSNRCYFCTLQISTTSEALSELNSCCRLLRAH